MFHFEFGFLHRHTLSALKGDDARRVAEVGFQVHELLRVAQTRVERESLSQSIEKLLSTQSVKNIVNHLESVTWNATTVVSLAYLLSLRQLLAVGWDSGFARLADCEEADQIGTSVSTLRKRTAQIDLERVLDRISECWRTEEEGIVATLVLYCVWVVSEMGATAQPNLYEAVLGRIDFGSPFIDVYLACACFWIPDVCRLTPNFDMSNPNYVAYVDCLELLENYQRLFQDHT